MLPVGNTQKKEAGGGGVGASIGAAPQEAAGGVVRQGGKVNGAGPKPGRLVHLSIHPSSPTPHPPTHPPPSITHPPIHHPSIPSIPCASPTRPSAICPLRWAHCADHPLFTPWVKSGSLALNTTRWHWPGRVPNRF